MADWTARALSLVAVLIWALLPAGVMPAPDGAGGAAFVLCSGEGPVTVAIGADGVPRPVAPGDSAAHKEICPFAGGAALAQPAPAPLPPLATLSAPADVPLPRALLPRATLRHLRPEGRGPPVLS